LHEERDLKKDLEKEASFNRFLPMRERVSFFV
jgi:hypothetical protein